MKLEWMIKNRNYLTFAITAILWIVIFIIFIASKQLILMSGTEITLEPRPVDPRDLFRGEYVTVGYDISRIDVTQYGYEENMYTNKARGFDYEETIYVSLSPDVQGVYRVAGISKTKPETGIFIQGKVTNPYSETITIEYGIESYFVEKNTAYLIEDRMDDGLLVKVVVDKNGRAIIKEFI